MATNKTKSRGRASKVIRRVDIGNNVQVFYRGKDRLGVVRAFDKYKTKALVHATYGRTSKSTYFVVRADDQGHGELGAYKFNSARRLSKVSKDWERRIAKKRPIAKPEPAESAGPPPPRAPRLDDSEIRLLKLAAQGASLTPPKPLKVRQYTDSYFAATRPVLLKLVKVEPWEHGVEVHITSAGLDEVAKHPRLEPEEASAFDSEQRQEAERSQSRQKATPPPPLELSTQPSQLSLVDWMSKKHNPTGSAAARKIRPAVMRALRVLRRDDPRAFIDATRYHGPVLAALLIDNDAGRTAEARVLLDDLRVAVKAARR